MRAYTYFLSMLLIAAASGPADSAETSHYGMKPVSIAGATEKIVIADMPRTRDQGGYGICYAVIASTLIDHATCATVKAYMTRRCVRERGLSKEICSLMIEDENKNYCKNLAPEFSVSVFDVARFNSKPRNNSNGYPDYFDREAFIGIKEGGDLPYTLNNAVRTSMISNNACAPFEQVLPKIDDRQQRMLVNYKFWQDLSTLYTKQRNGELNKAALLTEFHKLKDGLEIRATDEEVLTAFGDLDIYGRKKTENAMAFEGVVENLFVREECRSIEEFVDVNLQYEAKVFPLEKMPMNKRSYATALAHVKAVMKDNKTPLGIGFCADPAAKTTIKSVKECSDQTDGQGKLTKTGFMHTVAIKGYARVCDKKGKNCYDALQIQNSWSEQWQQENNDGWVDARILLDRSFYEKNSITWLEAEKPTQF